MSTVAPMIAEQLAKQKKNVIILYSQKEKAKAIFTSKNQNNNF